MPTNEMKIIAAARAYDRIGLRERGWSENQIDRAFRQVPTPSETSLKIARAMIEAAEKIQSH
ncbi:hypothetical protein [Roseovarius sp. MMSF_3350]|uniref:hypothetical protein n=1 Tax=Roseovarius sp. MMSF_3350 TaxID=3046706 RepID=UPI00273EC409|nr:hypothetical protein [Roseovarius sp. MMSF_3350]